MAEDKDRERQYKREWRERNQERCRGYGKKYYDANREKEAARHKRERAANPEPYREAQRRWRLANPDYQRKRYQAEKQAVLDAYGGQCACCGEANVCFLTVDHVNNDGNAHRKDGFWSGVFIYRWLKNNGFPKKGFQLLCCNCNGSKQNDREGHRRAHPNAILIDGGDADATEEGQCQNSPSNTSSQVI